MKVKEFIEKLLTYDGDANIYYVYDSMVFDDFEFSKLLSDPSEGEYVVGSDDIKLKANDIIING